MLAPLNLLDKALSRRALVDTLVSVLHGHA
jgi:hypothetical protein